MCPWIDYWNFHHNSSFTYNNIKTWDIHKYLNCDISEFWKYMDNFKLEGNYSNLKSNREVLQWFKNYGDYFHHIVITATPLNTAHISAEWTFRNYGRWIRDFVCIPSYRNGDGENCFDKSKKDYFLRTNIADIFIDDNPLSCEDVIQETEMKVFCVKKPWNNGVLIKDILNELTGYIK